MANPMFPYFKEGNSLFNGLSLDKISFRVHRDRINKNAITGLRGKGFFNITETGGYFDINIHAEGLIPWENVLAQCAWYFSLMAYLGVFDIYTCMGFIAFFTENKDWNDPETNVFFSFLLEAAEFVWVQHEIAYDFVEPKCPVYTPAGTRVKKYRGTLYSDDDSRQYRTVVQDGQEYRESKGSRDSTVCVYNRGRKIRSDNPIQRIEIRLQKHHLVKLPLWELVLPFPFWVYSRQEYLSKCLRLAKTKRWCLKRESIRPEHFMLRDILEKGKWALE